MRVCYLLLAVLAMATEAWAQAPLTVGNLTAQPGQKASGWLEVPDGVDAGTRIPVSVVHGARPGAVLALVAGTHGYEYTSILALPRVLARLDPQRMTGSVILVHAQLMGAGAALAFEVPLAPLAGTGFATSAPGNGLDSLRVLEAVPAAVAAGRIGSSQAAVKDLDVDPTSGRIYTIDFMPNGDGQQVFVVDPVTGAGTPLPNRTGLAAPSSSGAWPSTRAVPCMVADWECT